MYAIFIFEIMNNRSEPKLIRYHAHVAFVECRNFCLNNENYLDLRAINTKSLDVMRQSTRTKKYLSFCEQESNLNEPQNFTNS